MIDADLKRFLSKVRRNERTGCWEWTAATRTWSREPWDGGYGAFSIGGRIVRAHKWIYEKLVERVPEGKVLLHTCDNRRCVSIWHIHPDTQAQNVLDMIRKREARLVGLGEVP